MRSPRTRTFRPAKRSTMPRSVARSNNAEAVAIMPGRYNGLAKGVKAEKRVREPSQGDRSIPLTTGRRVTSVRRMTLEIARYDDADREILLAMVREPALMREFDALIEPSYLERKLGDTYCD